MGTVTLAPLNQVQMCVVCGRLPAQIRKDPTKSSARQLVTRKNPSETRPLLVAALLPLS